MKLKTLCTLSLITALALGVYALEAQLPPIVPIPGIKAGLSNIMILLTLYCFGKREAGLVLLLKTVLGAALAGTLLSFFYSAAGGACAYAVMLLLRRHTGKRLWLLSAYGAAAHNFAQLAVARAVLGAKGIWWYLPVLLVSGIVTGCFTGLCAGFACRSLKRYTERK